MALTPEHRQEEWYQQMINAATGKYLPSISAQDAGKVMTVESDGSWGVENIPTELPSVTSSDESKVLTVDNNGDWVAADAPSGLPSTESASAGDVLSLNNSKEAVWTTPSSGGGVLVVTGTIDEGARAITLDKTWQEIHDVGCGTIIIAERRSIDALSIYFITGQEGFYAVNAYMVGDFSGDGELSLRNMSFTTNSATGYPSMGL